MNWVLLRREQARTHKLAIDTLSALGFSDWKTDANRGKAEGAPRLTESEREGSVEVEVSPFQQEVVVRARSFFPEYLFALSVPSWFTLIVSVVDYVHYCGLDIRTYGSQGPLETEGCARRFTP